MGLLQSCTKPSISFFFLLFPDVLFYFFSTSSWKIIPYLRFYFFSTWSWKIIPYLRFLDLKLENYSLFTFLLIIDLKLENYSIFRWLSARLVYSSELAVELLRSCTKPSIYFFSTFSRRTFLLFLDLKLENYSVFTFLLFLDLQDCSNSSELAMGLLRSCTKPSIYFFIYFFTTNFFYFFSTSSWKIIPYLRFYFFSTWSWKIILYLRFYFFSTCKTAVTTVN